MDKNQMVKAIWKGIGKEPQYREYGYGTGRAIPSQIWEQVNNPESHWEFVYGQDYETQQSQQKYLNTPVWFYEVGGQVYFTQNNADIPDEAEDAYSGHVYDAYRLKAEKKEKPSKPIAPKDLQARRLREIEASLMLMAHQGISATIDPNTKHLVLTKTTSPDEGSLLPVYMQALSSQNGTLVVGLKNFVESSKQQQIVSMYDLMGTSSGAEVDFLRMSEDAQTFIDALVKAKDKQQLDSALLNISKEAHSSSAESDESLTWEPIDYSAEATVMSEMQEAVASVETPAEPAKRGRGRPRKNPLPEGSTPAAPVESSEYTPIPNPVFNIDRNSTSFFDNIVVRHDIVDVAPFDPHANVDERRKKVSVREPIAPVVKEQREFSFAMPQLTSKGLVRGANFVNSIPSSALESAFNSLQAGDRGIIAMALPGMFRMEKGTVKVIPSNQRTSSSEALIVGTAQQKQLIPILQKFSEALEATNYRTIIGADPDEYSPLFLDNLMLRNHLNGAEVGALVSNVQYAFRLSVIKLLKMKGQGELAATLQEGADLNLNQLDADTIREALVRVNRFAYEADDEGEISYTPLGNALKNAADKSGITESEALDLIRDTFMQNMKEKGPTSTAESYSRTLGKTYAGNLLGLMIGSIRGAMRNVAKNKGSQINGQMHLVHDDMDRFAEEIFGSRAFLASDDMMSYRTSEGKDIHFSVSMWQAVHFALPYHYNENQQLIVDLHGEEINFSALPYDKKEAMRDELMRYIASQTNPRTMTAFDADKLQYTMLKKYQSALANDPLMSETLKDYMGKPANIEQLDPADSVVHQPSLEKVHESLNSLSNYLLSGVAQMMESVDSIPTSFRFSGSRKESIKAVLLDRAARISLQASQFTREMGIGDKNYSLAANIITQSIDAFIDDFVDNKLTEDMEGKHITKAGYSIEFMSMVAPILSMMADPRYKDHHFEFMRDGDTSKLMKKIPLSDMVEGEIPKTGYKFFDAMPDARGFHFKVNGQEHFVINDSNQTNGAGDILHMADTDGGRQFHSYESKLGKGTPERSHLSYVARNLRNILLLGRGKTAKIGGYRTINLRYEAEGGHRPDGLPEHLRKYGNPSMNKYGLPTEGNSLNITKFAELMSSTDGFGLAGVKVL